MSGGSPVSKRRRLQNPFAISETDEGGGAIEEEDEGSQEEEGEEEEDKEEEGEEDGDEGEAEAGGTPSLYRRLENEREEQVWAQPPGVPPYFPSGLCVDGLPLHFNFDLFLLDSLHLPCGLFQEDKDDAVSFESVPECQAYCRRFAQDALKEAVAWQAEEGTQATTTTAAALDKKAMFFSAGTSLEGMLASGSASCNRQLSRVRQDRFGNVMVLGAPGWSDLSPHFMHGFPRRLVSADHGGFLPGNICVVARISNQAMRSSAPGDIAAFCSRQSMANLGLTLSELFLARQAALVYSGQSRQPQRLVHSMLRYGVDFLTFSALGTDDFHSLAELTLNTYMNQDQQRQSDEQSSSDTEGAASNDSLELDSSFLRDRVSQSEREHRPRLQTQLLNQFLGGAGEGSTAPGQLPQDRTSHRRVVKARAESSMSAGGSSGSSSRQRRSRNKGAGAPAVEGASSTAEAAAPPLEEDLRECLARVPGVIMGHLPSPSALVSLREFITKHVPVSQAVDGQAPRTPGAQGPLSPSALFGEVARGLHKSQRTLEVNSMLQGVWDIVVRECICTALLPGNEEEGVSLTPSEQCPFRISQAMGRDIDPASGICLADCLVCEAFQDYCKIQTCSILTSLDKNSRLQGMVTLGSLMVTLLWGRGSPDSSEEQKSMKALFQGLLCCGKDKLDAVLSVGHLVRNHTPRIAQVYLASGWSDFWREMRRVSTILLHQDSHRARSAMLAYIRMKCVPPGNAWAYYLTSPDETAETQALEALLGHSTAERPTTSATTTTTTTPAE